MQFEILLRNHPTHFYWSISHSLHNYDGCAPQVPRQLGSALPAICRYRGRQHTDCIITAIKARVNGIAFRGAAPVVRFSGICYTNVKTVTFNTFRSSVFYPDYGILVQLPDSYAVLRQQYAAILALTLL